MGNKIYYYLWVFIYWNHISVINGCTLYGVSNQFWLPLEVVDIDRGEFSRIETSGITAIRSAVHSGDAINRGPYIEARMDGDYFVLTLHDNFINYEEDETSLEMSFVVTFDCEGTTQPLVTAVTVTVIDTNNNNPSFTPPEMSFTVAPPLPPGFDITGCFNDIVVRDIDLSTYQINFDIQDNPYFEILFDSVSPTDPKMFYAILRTKALLRSLSEPMVLTITATDVDRTGDPPRSAGATITIEGSNEFELPDEIIFEDTFYLGTYTENDNVILDKDISLIQGFDQYVIFNISGDYNTHFRLNGMENALHLIVVSPLPQSIIDDNTHLFLVVTAEREHTTGATSAIIIELPKAINLQFEQHLYHGTIDFNILNAPHLKLMEGYEDGFTVTIVSDYEIYFNYDIINENEIILNMDALDESVLQSNSFISLQVIATSRTSTATAVVTLDIIKDDMSTPVFEKDIYAGHYETVGGLQLEDVILIQGYDNTVTFTIEGDDGDYFEYDENENVLKVIANIPPDIVESEQQLIFSIRASKPRTVGASTTVTITLPSAINLEFEHNLYHGTIDYNTLTAPNLRLIEGYSDGFTVTIVSDYESFFHYNVFDGNEIVLNMDALDESVLQSNSFISLQVIATSRISTATAVVTLDIIKDDMSTPVFEKNIYAGHYETVGGLQLEDVILIQGYDNTVTFTIEGDDGDYFEYDENENVLKVIANIPPDIVESEQQLIFSIRASKPRTVGASTTVTITLPSAINLEFEHNLYHGTIDYNTLNAPNLRLIEGYSEGFTVTIVSDYESFFNYNVFGGNEIILNMDALDESILAANSFISLQVIATSRTSTATAVVTLDIIKDDMSTPVFEKDIYAGHYEIVGGLQLEDVILIQGYDNTVTFTIEGDDGDYFEYDENENVLKVIANIPPDIVESEQQLIFSIRASKPRTVGASTTVTITLPSDYLETVAIRFEHSSYLGSLHDNYVTLDTLTVVDGYADDVTFTLGGVHASYFELNYDNAPVISLHLHTPIPEEVTQSNNVILLEVIASRPLTISGYATIVLEIESDSVVLGFDEAYYSGSFSETTGFVFTDTITLDRGYDDSVTFRLEGEHSEWFNYIEVENSVRIILETPIPSAVLANNQHLTFTIVAERAPSASARAAIIIALPDDYLDAIAIRFEHSSYLGSLHDNYVTLDTLTVVDGYADDVTFTLGGAHASYFELNYDNAPVISLNLHTPIPEEVTQSNNVILLEVIASRPLTISGYATIVLAIESDSVVFGFDEAYYSGSFSETTGFVFTDTITLDRGYDDSVTFRLEGEHSEWFNYIEVENSVRIILETPIPSAVLANNQHLTFTIVAERAPSASARAAIIIALPDDYIDAIAIRFEHSSYLGSLHDNYVTLDTLTVVDGYADDVTFTLGGAHASYFELNYDNAPVISLNLHTPIPEEVTQSNNVILLEVIASRPLTISGYATIVLAIESDSVVFGFDEAYYSGSFSETTGFVFTDTITLDRGYDDSVTFRLEGEHSEWFNYIEVENSVRIILETPIPSAVLANNQHLAFTIVAERAPSASARAAIIIALPDDYLDAIAIRFEHSSYLGSLHDNYVTLDTLTVVDGYADDVTFTLGGAHASYFELNYDNAPVISLNLHTPIPEEVTQSNNVILLEVIASRPLTISGYATIVLAIESDSVVFGFDEAYYSGSFSETTGFVFTDTITLDRGYDDSVTFRLEGEHSEWFNYIEVENSVRIILETPIPSAVLANNQHLTFTIVAERAPSASARAAIIIALPDDYLDAIAIRFEHSSYLGSLHDNYVTLDTLTVVDGYADDVTFTLGGAHASYFELNYDNAPVISLNLHTPIPEEVTQSNNVILLEVIASRPLTISGYATIVLAIESDSVVFGFDEAYYSGSFSETTGFVFTDTITLDQGYDDSVTFRLEGEHSEWFNYIEVENSVRIILETPIPSAVLANNQHLTFTIVAQRAPSASARAAIIIALPDDYLDAIAIRFEHSSYLGSLHDNYVTLDTLTVVDGYADDVTFTLGGAHASYFELNYDNAPVISLNLHTPIPEEVTQSNNVILLEVIASRPLTISGYATIVLAIESDSVVFGFDEAYYSGSFSETTGFVFTDTITLDRGYDDSVTFRLEGEHSEWFNYIEVENSVRIILETPIPSAVLANNQHLTFTIVAERAPSASARAAIIIALPDDYLDAIAIRFEHSSYLGSLHDNYVTLDTLTVVDGYADDVTFTLGGAHASYFELNYDNAPVISLNLHTPIPEEVTQSNNVILLEVIASRPLTISGYATIVLAIESDSVVFGFDEAYYSGSFSETTGFVFTDTITLDRGYDDSVTFRLEGEHSEWFNYIEVENSVRIILETPIPSAVLANNQHLTFTIVAERAPSASARAAIIIALPDDYLDAIAIRFEHSSYLGSLHDNYVTLDTLTVVDGYADDVTFTLGGVHASYFELNYDNAPVISLHLHTPIPEEVTQSNNVILLEVIASRPLTISGYATIVLEIESDSVVLGFDEAYYSGSFSETTGFVFTDTITLDRGYDDSVMFRLEGEHSEWFNYIEVENSVRIILETPIPSAVLANNQHLTFTIVAERAPSASARAAIIIALPDDYLDAIAIRFEHSSYLGSLYDNYVTLDTLTVVDGYADDVTFTLGGVHASYFELNYDNAPVISLHLHTPIPEEVTQSNNVILLEVIASRPLTISGYATIVLEIESDSVVLRFDEAYYSGSFSETTGFVFTDTITLDRGYDDSVTFRLEGEHSEWFNYIEVENSVRIILETPIPSAVLANNQHLTFTIVAERAPSASARAAIIIDLTDGSHENVYFREALYKGSFQSGAVNHEAIEIMGYSGSEIEITGELDELFMGRVANGQVYVEAISEASIPLEIRHVAVQLQAATARTALVLNVLHPDETVPPSVEFDSSSYTFRVEITQTGFIGRVQATTNNGEGLLYSLQINNEHLLERLSINSFGELHLSAPANSGQYYFNIEAITAATEVSATANAQLSVVAVSMCGNNIMLPPLLILNRNEEEAHEDILVLPDDLINCNYSLLNHWPVDQQWLTVDERGLHSKVIDREDPSIAFMALSQIQVELILHCDTIEPEMRSEINVFEISNRSTVDGLGPYDYGDSKWILTDSILFNSRRTFVNLIVNDINDNTPIFVDKEQEPIIVGYPDPELLHIVMPRALIELKATDEDVGENARLVYWSDEPELAVARDSGTVHVRDITEHMEYGRDLTVNVTDRSGEGLTGSIKIQVRLLNVDNIAIITIHDALLEDEEWIIKNINENLNYKVNTLRATVISTELEENIPEEQHYINKQSVQTHIRSKQLNRNSRGAFLQLYLYGLVDGEPVTVSELINDINNNLNNIISVADGIPLEDFIEDTFNCPAHGRDVGLLAATIVLSVLLFIAIAFISLWYFFKIRKANNYKEFIDTNSLASTTNSTNELSKTEGFGRTKLNIEELKKSERRLQEMLNAPITGDVEGRTTNNDVNPQNSEIVETIIDISPIEKNPPIIIQSIDKLKDAGDESEEEDEFGEIKGKSSRRKSVVTFNENVEKIIHVEDNIEDTIDNATYEVDRL